MTGLRLARMRRDEMNRAVFTYELQHSTPGRDGTTLRLELELTVGLDGTESAFTFDGPSCATPDAALDKMAEGLERSAAAIRARKTDGFMVPMFEGGK